MKRVGSFLLFAGLLLAATFGWSAQEKPHETALKFEVTVAKDLLKEPRDGRLLVVLAPTGAAPRPRRGGLPSGEPRLGLENEIGLDAPPVLGVDVKKLAPGVVAVADQSSVIFPIASLSSLPAGEYRVQAVFDHNRDLRLPNAPGNLYSAVTTLQLDPSKGTTVKIELTKAIPDETLPPDTATVKYIKLKSELMSKFFGRDMFLRACVVLPAGFDTDKDKRYPLRVHIGGYGTRFTAGARLAGRRGADTPPMLYLHLDGAGPFGDPYQVNSANNGPLGDAVTQELIPYVEKKYRGIGEGYARFTDGASTGGWVSFALQVFYPDFFNGCWSHAPDPVDFRSYELIDVYDPTDENAYVNKLGFERPAKRMTSGETVYTVRHECLMERVLGMGDRWELSGKDWCAWNATFGPRGDDGLPKPLWDGKTGKIDRSVVEHWKKYDLRLVLENNWSKIGPKLKGKIHIWVGDADDYFLNNAVHKLDTAMSRKPGFDGKITYGPGGGHGFTGISQEAMLREMSKAAEAGKAAAAK